MNFNDYPEVLRDEEQKVLDWLISRMNCVLDSLDERMKRYVYEARTADPSLNPDELLGRILAQQGIQDTEENRRKILQARDELYHTRLLLQCEEEDGHSDIEEIRVGLHSCIHGKERFVTKWTMPVCRHYLLDNGSIEFTYDFRDNHGKEYHPKYKLLVKNQVTLRFTHVVKAMNLFPGIFDVTTLETLKGTNFFSNEFLDEMIEKFNPDDFDPDGAANIISDEFLQELIERRSTPEFKNIVFSIQKKQGEIICATYNRNMVVQGCAGSGKSMIMLHRLPVLLYDNPDNLTKTNLYVITPSQMYIQLAEKMRYQLEISDLNMGTVEQYYDYCIAKYSGHKSGEYGEISYHTKISSENEQYVYSQKCIADIIGYFESLENDYVSLEKAHAIFPLTNNRHHADTYAQRINNRLLELQNLKDANNKVIMKYFKEVRDILDGLYTLSAVLRHRKNEVVREITKRVSKSREEILKAQKEMEKLNPDENAVAIQNRKNIIEAEQKIIDDLRQEMMTVEADNEYFATLLKVNAKIESVLEPFKILKNEFGQNTERDVYDAIGRAGQLIGGFFMVSWELSRIEDKYMSYLGSISKEAENARRAVSILQSTTDSYLDYEYYSEITEEYEKLYSANLNAVVTAYKMIMKNIGIEPTESGKIRAIKCSPYIYLQALYCYQGAPSYRETLIAIDEVQGIAKEELRLLKNINGNNVILNMYGDIYQHIEGTKGIDSWDDCRDIIDFDYYEMVENYRNASQITEYCNCIFEMNMNPINTPGKGVHELSSESEFNVELITQLMDTQRAGLAAILVSNDAEARKILNMFSDYEQKFHDMTDEESSVHRTKWNIINVDDAKGLEFSSVIVLSGRMSRNEKYIAFTRALDDLYIYSGLLDITGFEKKPGSKLSKDENRSNIHGSKRGAEWNQKDFSHSKVRMFFEENGFEVIDNRAYGGRLWVLGEKEKIRFVVNAAIAKFGISGKYATGKETKNRNGWCTKTEK